jgi:hypothetical protein
MNDDEGVLGRLPRSRPGTRSEKRAGSAGPKEGAPAKSRPAAGAARAAKGSEQRATKASRPAKGATARPAARKTRGAAQAPKTPPPHSAPPERGQAGDPIAGAVRAGVRAAEGGVKLAGGLTRGLLRRLPRP